jgi:hypothetical protein
MSKRAPSSTTPPSSITPPPSADASPRPRRLGMHRDVASWCDTCTCEAEPRWAAVGEELGMTEPSSDMPDEGADGSRGGGADISPGGAGG